MVFNFDNDRHDYHMIKNLTVQSFMMGIWCGYLRVTVNRPSSVFSRLHTEDRSVINTDVEKGEEAR